MNALTVGGLFDGIGLLAGGLHAAGLEHRWLCEVDPFRRQVLSRRWPGVRIYDDVRAVGADAERVDVIAGGFPCKGISSIGKQEGFGHPETVLWREMARTIRELRPRYVVVENVAAILGIHDGAVWGEVVGDLAACGYGIEWDCFPAAAFGAPHLRDRVIAVAADATLVGSERSGSSWQRRSGSTDGGPPAPYASRDAEGGAGASPWSNGERVGPRVDWGEYAPAITRWEAIHGAAPQPLVPRVDDGASARVVRSRLSAIGDGVQWQLGEMVGRFLMSELRVRSVA